MTDIVTQISTKETEYTEAITDRMLFSVATNAFSNLAARAEFLDEATTVRCFRFQNKSNLSLENVHVILC
jgi:hypothetical protein